MVDEPIAWDELPAATPDRKGVVTLSVLRSFRLSTYLTLVLACLRRGDAEGDLLPEVPYITVGAIASIGIAYRVEGRWSLSRRWANSVGIFYPSLLSFAGSAFSSVATRTACSNSRRFPPICCPFSAPC